MDKDEYIKKWSEKLSISVEDINKEFDKVLLNEKEIHKDLSEDIQNQRALQRVALSYRKQLKSPAVGFEGTILGASDCVDIVARQRAEANKLYKDDPQAAINQGVTNEAGVPLVTRETWPDGRPNVNFGKPLAENTYLRNIYGIAIKKGDESPRYFSMIINGPNALNEDLPVFKPVKFRALDKTKDEDKGSLYQLNASTYTEFEVDESLELPPYKELINTCCSSMVSTLDGLQDYHNKTKDNFNRLVILEGDVSSLNLVPTAYGSRIMTLEDINKSLEDLDSAGITCWIPSRCNVDFAEGSKVIVVGRTGQGNKKDDQGNITEELRDVSLNILGMYAIPEFKIALPDALEEITEDKLI